MKKKYLIIILHIAAWLCFFLLPIVFLYTGRDAQSPLSQTMQLMIFCLNLYLVGFYYLNAQVLIPKLLAQKRWLWYALAIVLCLYIFIQLPRLFEDALNAETPERVHRSGRRRNRLYPFTGGTAVFFLVLTVSTCVKVIQQWLAAEKKQEEIAHEKINTELSFLKSQINPHFLFNTLNNIYSLAVVKSDATAGAVMKLSSIMRYVLSETKQHLVPLDKEIKFIQDYIDLQQVRLTEKIKVSFTVSGDTENRQIAPLLLMPFVENAFKYGISTKEHSEIKISIEARQGAIEFLSDNKVIATETDRHDNNGIGLKNTRRRLEILYPGKHQLEILRENNHFKVHLNLSE